MLTLLLSLVLSAQAMSQTVVLQPLPGQSSDLSIREDLPDDITAGMGTALYVIRPTGTIYRTMVGFDLTGASYGVEGVPPGSKIVSAKLTFNCLAECASAIPVDVHMVKPGFAISSLTTTWNSANDGVPWITPGGDYERVAVATFNAPIVTGDFDITGLGDAVQDALDLNDANATFLLKYDDEASMPPRSFAMFSSESEFDPDPRLPRLTIVYLPAPYAAVATPAPPTDVDGVRDSVTTASWVDLPIGDSRTHQATDTSDP